MVSNFTVRRASERGHREHGWLDTYHTFSFGDYDDPRYRSYRSLRVMNDDRVAPGEGFGEHGHREMEILTVVLSGELAHQDSMGHGTVLRPGEWQRMSAGTGLRHAEHNPSSAEPVHFYQIWLRPAVTGVVPSYEQRGFAPAGRLNQWQTIVTPTGIEDTLKVNQDAVLRWSQVDPGRTIRLPLSMQRHYWLQILSGAVSLEELSLAAGDGVAWPGGDELVITATAPSLVLLFDLA